MAIPKELGDALGFQIYRSGLLLRRHLMRALKDWGLTPEQWQTLAVLTYYEKPLTQQELCEVTLLDRHACSKMLARMNRDGWIKRVESPYDKRSKLISPTLKAKKETPKIIEALKGAFDPLWKKFTQKEKKETSLFCQKLFEHLQ